MNVQQNVVINFADNLIFGAKNSFFSKFPFSTKIGFLYYGFSQKNISLTIFFLQFFSFYSLDPTQFLSLFCGVHFKNGHRLVFFFSFFSLFCSFFFCNLAVEERTQNGGRSGP